MFFYINPFDTIEKYDSKYDESCNLVLVNRNLDFWDINYSMENEYAHHLCTSLEYAQMLLNKNTLQSIKRASDIITAVISFQDINAGRKSFGLLPGFSEIVVYDSEIIPNTLYICFHLLQIIDCFGNILSESLLASVKQTCYNIAYYFSLNKNDLCYKCAYFTLVEIFVMQRCGILFDKPEFEHYSHSLLNTYYSGTLYNENFWEYGSHYESYLISETLSMLKLYVNEIMFSKAVDSLYNLIWKNIAENYHAGLGIYTGPKANISKIIPIEQFRMFILHAIGKPVKDYKSCTPIFSKCPSKYVFHFFTENPKKNLQALVSRGSTYRFSYISRIATNYIRPNYALGSFNHEYFWYGNEPLVGYFGNTEDLHVVSLKVLNNGHDFASAKINCIQNKNTILGHIFFVSNRGDKHLSLDTGLITTNDLRIRLSVFGKTSGMTVIRKKDCFFVSSGKINLNFSIPFTAFDNRQIKYNVIKDAERLHLDAILLKSEKDIKLDFKNINEAICQFILKMTDSDCSLPKYTNTCDGESLFSSVIIGSDELKLKSLTKPSVYEYSDLYDKQFINELTLPEYTYIIQKNVEQYNFITSSGLKSISNEPNNKLEKYYNAIDACEFTDLSEYIPVFFDELIKLNYPLAAFKRNAIELIKSMFNKIKEQNYQFEYIINNNYFDIYKKISIASDYSSVQGVVNKAYQLLAKNIISSEEHTKRNNLVNDVMLILEQNYSNPSLSLKTVSDSLGISESYISRTIKNKTHITYVQHLIRIRIENAKEMLLSGISAEKTAEKCGYLSLSGFKRAFKEYTGMTISTWLKK